MTNATRRGRPDAASPYVRFCGGKQTALFMFFATLVVACVGTLSALGAVEVTFYEEKVFDDELDSSKAQQALSPVIDGFCYDDLGHGWMLDYKANLGGYVVANLPGGTPFAEDDSSYISFLGRRPYILTDEGWIRSPVSIPDDERAMSVKIEVPSYVTKVIEVWRKIRDEDRIVGTEWVSNAYMRTPVRKIGTGKPLGYEIGFGELIIPDTVREIAGSAFRDLGIQKFTLGNGLKEIGPSAFAGCDATEITVPKSVTFVDDYCFSGCGCLKKVSFENPDTQLGENVFSHDTVIETVKLPTNLTKLPYGTFYWSGLKTCHIPNTVAEIGSFAFCLSSIQEVEMPLNLKSIGFYAFEGCEDLEYVLHIPNAVTNIDAYCFAGCLKLTTVDLPTQLDFVSEGLFRCCSNLRYIDIPPGIRRIDANAFFGCSKLEDVDYAKTCGVTDIGKSAFESCTNLPYAEIPKSVKRLGERAFASTGITCVDFEKGGEIEALGVMDGSPDRIDASDQADADLKFNRYYGSEGHDGVFADCTELADFTLPEGVSVGTIGRGTFDRCTALTNITIAGSVSNLSFAAIGTCQSNAALSVSGYVGAISNHKYQPEIYRPDKVTGYDRRFFGFGEPLGNIGTVEVTGEIGKVGPMAFSMLTLKTFELKGRIGELSAQAFKRCGTLTNFVVRSEGRLDRIGDGAFYACTNLASVVFETVTAPRLGDGIWGECTRLREVKLPPTVDNIGNADFYCCSNLVNFTLPTSVTNIGYDAFMNNAKLKVSKLPSDLRTIGYSAFDGCKSITRIVFPDALSFVGRRAFADCLALGSFHLHSVDIEDERDVFAGCTALKSATTDIPDVTWYIYSGLQNLRTMAHITDLLVNSRAKTVELNDPSKTAQGFHALGLSPSVTEAEDETVVVTYVKPTLSIAAFDPTTGSVDVKVEIPEGMTLSDDLDTQAVVLYGATELDGIWQRISSITVDATEYLSSEHGGMFSIAFPVGTCNFYKVVVE